MFRNSINNIGDCILKLILMVNSCRKFNYFMLLIVLKILPLTTSHNIIQPPKYMIENNTILWSQNTSHFSDVQLLIQNKSTPASNKSFICHCSTTVGEIGIEVSSIDGGRSVNIRFNLKWFWNYRLKLSVIVVDSNYCVSLKIYFHQYKDWL